ncbi:DUF1198 family protein [Billgrantia sp. Q4P2]|uniref:DUF1198 family protein n=1 Tax=Billgrantia sp. Q4P2 TaxID=3463857 RepID=UPI004057501A
MNWYWIIGIAIALAIIYRLISEKPKSVAYEIGRRINVKPHFIESMITAMGSKRGLMFVDQMSRGGDEFIEKGVYTFIVFEISKNDHAENIKWWKSRLKESGFDPQMNAERAEVAFTYLKDAGADHSQIPNFINVYNSIS